MTTAGGVKCWGQNRWGALGAGTRTDHLTPIDVGGLTSGATAVSARFRHTCALTKVGAVKCWGNNNLGQQGDGTRTDRPTLVQVSGLAGGVAAVSAGQWHTCALTKVGGVKCWGDNGLGELGDGTTTHRLTPVEVGGLTPVVAAVPEGDTPTR